MGKITIYDIAAAAGVSSSSVSRALSGTYRGRKELSAKISALAQEMGYTANIHARNLRKGSSGNIGLVMLDCRGEHHAGLSDLYKSQTHDIINEFNGRDLGVLSFGSSQKSYLCEYGQVDGIVLMARDLNANDDMLQKIATSRLPAVVFSPFILSNALSSVSLNCRLAASIATEHLLQTNCRNLLFVYRANSPNAQHHHEGFCAGSLGASQLQSAAIEVVHSDGPAEVRALFSLLRQAGRKVDGILAEDNYLAEDIIKALVLVGHRVPDDVSVVGLGDFGHPPHSGITTIRMAPAMASAMLADALIASIDGARPTHRLCAPSLVQNASTRVPASPRLG